MRYKGYNFRLSHNYFWRRGDPTRDVNRSGNPVKSNYLVIVKVKDCLVTKREGNNVYLNAKDAPQAVILGYSRTNMGYGPKRKYKDHFTFPIYLVYDGRVYTSSSRWDD